MKQRDPIEELERYYGQMKRQPVRIFPPVAERIKWWEAAGGLAAGVAAVVIAVSFCVSPTGNVQAESGTLLLHQMRSAGMAIEADIPTKRAQRKSLWAI
jgi:hypothetical protein